MRIGLLGDTHGNHAWIKLAAREFEACGIDTVIQVGDLGVSGNTRDGHRWDRTSKYLLKHGITLLVAPGNHEDYDYIDAMRPRQDGWLEFRSNILLAPRGHRTEIDDRTFVWLGGAGSVDRTLRNEWQTMSGVGPKYWWEQEAITDEDVARTIADGHAEVMISHDAPTGVAEIDFRLLRTAHYWNEDDLVYAQACREKFTEAVAGVAPDLLIHGHYHFAVQGRWANPDTRTDVDVFGLARDGDLQAALGVLDTETRRPRLIDVSGPRVSVKNREPKRSPPGHRDGPDFDHGCRPGWPAGL